MSKRVNSLEGNIPPFVESTLSATPFPNGSHTESYASSTKSCSAGDWLLLSDMEFDLNKRWALGDVKLDYTQAADLLAL